MKAIQKGSVIYNDSLYNYEVDKHGFIWLLLDSGKTNFGQIKPVTKTDNVEEVVRQMLYCAGY